MGARGQWERVKMGPASWREKGTGHPLRREAPGDTHAGQGLGGAVVVGWGLHGLSSRTWSL